MRGRPLCVFCLVFLVIQVIFIRGFQLGKDWKPSLLEQTVDAGSVISVSGGVYHKEIKKDNLVIYLKAKSYQTNIIVYLKQDNPNNETIHIGNEIDVTGEVAYFDEPRNPGNFNQKFYYQKQGIHGMIWAQKIHVTDVQENVWKESLSNLRMKWKALLLNVLGEKNGNIMSAILLGDKSELDTELKELYQKNGIGHILAISGLHMTFIGIGFYQFLRRRGFSFASAGTIGIIFLISYTMMIGNGVASMRALIMFMVRIGADITGRVYDMLTALALAAIIILMWRPMYLYDAGFLLSFGAILGVLLIYPLLQCQEQSDRKKRVKNMEGIPKVLAEIKMKLQDGLYGSVSINLAILPCMLYFYFEFPPYSVFLNLLVIPMMSVVLGTGVLGSLLYLLLPMPGTGVLWICKPVLTLYEGACEFCIGLPGSHLVVGQPKPWQIVLYYVVLGIMLVSLQRKRETVEEGQTERSAYDDRKQQKRWYACFCIGAALNLLILCIRWNEVVVLRHHISITMLDVGQGDGLVIRGNSGIVCIVDGGSTDVSEVGKYRIEPYLKSQGIGTIDYAFISHGDSDHYNGIEEMLQRQQFGVKIRYLVLPDSNVQDEKLKALAAVAYENGVEVVMIRAGEKIVSGGTDAQMKLTCVAPTSDYSGEIGNASSMVLSLSYEEFDMLFTGDVEGEGEKLLTEELETTQQDIQNEINIKYEILKVAHHGSKNSSTSEFLEVVNPNIALISAGRNNRYGHPHEETINKLKDMGCQIENTQETGALLILTDGKRIRVIPYL